MDAKDLSPDPFEQFRRWMAEAVARKIELPERVALATSTRDGKPSLRMVLLKGVDAKGFVFFTNYESRKASELESNPRAALAFYWHEFERQVRIEGTVERVSSEDSNAYYQIRPYEKRIGAWASPQSQPLASRAELESRAAALREKYPEGTPVPRPPFWGGYRIVPELLEFWVGHTDRLHDRFVYTPKTAGTWNITRLAP